MTSREREHSRVMWQQLEKHDCQQLTVAMSEQLGSAMTTIVVVALMVGSSHSVAWKTDMPELVCEDTGRQAEQSCIQYAVAPAANGDHAVVALNDHASSLRI